VTIRDAYNIGAQHHGTNQVTLGLFATYVFPIRNKVSAGIVPALISGASAEFPSLIARCFVEATLPKTRLLLGRARSLLLTLADFSLSRLSCSDILALLGAALTFRLGEQLCHAAPPVRYRLSRARLFSRFGR
jgi:hypothetical protein